MGEELLDAAARTPEQLRQVNALCRLVEMATLRTRGAEAPIVVSSYT